LYDQRQHPFFSDPNVLKTIEGITRRKYTPTPVHDDDAYDGTLVPMEISYDEYKANRDEFAGASVSDTVDDPSSADEAVL
jgi:hypothetical protein